MNRTKLHVFRVTYHMDRSQALTASSHAWSRLFLTLKHIQKTNTKHGELSNRKIRKKKIKSTKVIISTENASTKFTKNGISEFPDGTKLTSEYLSPRFSSSDRSTMELLRLSFWVVWGEKWGSEDEVFKAGDGPKDADAGWIGSTCWCGRGNRRHVSVSDCLKILIRALIWRQSKIVIWEIN